jgi:hypothetical protein
MNALEAERRPRLIKLLWASTTRDINLLAGLYVDFEGDGKRREVERTVELLLHIRIKIIIYNIVEKVPKMGGWPSGYGVWLKLSLNLVWYTRFS